ncbi:MAG: hypothetical protein HZC38_17515 [Chloroflexi bacterium]|nr:hypothetical protein [Chloroflexota bacterium]
MSIDSLGLHLGPFYLRFYGIILITGAILGAYIASHLSRLHAAAQYGRRRHHHAVLSRSTQHLTARC